MIPIHEMICELESKGVISKTHSSFNSPTWPVSKSNGKWRPTVDYCGLNKVTPPSAIVPVMLDLPYELESKAEKSYANIDISNALFSIPLQQSAGHSLLSPGGVSGIPGTNNPMDRSRLHWKRVIQNCETCAAIKQAKQVKPLWYGGRLLKHKERDAWQIQYITLPQIHQGKSYMIMMVEATTGWLKTYPVPHTTAWNTILGLEKKVLW
ncbi:hypothetical protein BTVI_11110 [Pitangus sulphuratus]|nr:hypothetical protein BTVI_11110 [Pitangus sulphuratus]